jgi:hypothetical protein
MLCSDRTVSSKVTRGLLSFHKRLDLRDHHAVCVWAGAVVSQSLESVDLF